MNFGQPLYLWGLLGLSIPIVIHLLSRKEGKLIRIGSLRHILETSTRQFKSIRLNELVLLFLRCILLGLIVLLMSEWSWSLFSDHKKWFIVEKGLERQSSLIPLFDSLQVAEFEPHYFARGFPHLYDRQSGNERLDYNALIKELKKAELDSAIIFSYGRASAFVGARIALPSNVRWISMEPTPTKFVARAVQSSRDSVYFRTAISSYEQTSFDTERRLMSSDKSIPEAPDTISVVVAFDEAFEQDARIMMAILKSIQQNVPDVIVAKFVGIPKLNSARCDWLIWLSLSPVPEMDTQSIALHFLEDTKVLYQQDIQSYYLTSRLNTEIALKHNMALELTRILFPASDIIDHVTKLDAGVVDEKVMWSQSKGSSDGLHEEMGAGSMAEYLLVCIFVFLLLERVISYRRNQ